MVSDGFPLLNSRNQYGHPHLIYACSYIVIPHIRINFSFCIKGLICRKFTCPGVYSKWVVSHCLTLGFQLNSNLSTHSQTVWLEVQDESWWNPEYYNHALCALLITYSEACLKVHLHITVTCLTAMAFFPLCYFYSIWTRICHPLAKRKHDLWLHWDCDYKFVFSFFDSLGML